MPYPDNDYILLKPLVDYLLQHSGHREELILNWKRLEEEFNCKYLDIVKLHDGYRKGTFDGTEIIRGLIKDWIVSFGDKATIGKLSEILESAGFHQLAENLLKDFSPWLKIVERQKFHSSDLSSFNPETIDYLSKVHAAAIKPSNQARTWFDNLQFTSLLGQGSFGIVFKTRDKTTGEYSAVKIVFPEYMDPVKKEEKEQFTREFKELEGTRHPNLVRCLKFLPERQFTPAEINDLFVTPIGNLDRATRVQLRAYSAEAEEDGWIEAMCIQMELCGPTLRSWLQDVENGNVVPTNEIRVQIGQGIIDGIKFLHREGILHRDLKPENIYFAKDTGGYTLPVKIGDFGGCRKVHGNASETMTKDKGTFMYRAPEAIDRRRYGKQADLYSLGLVLLETFQIIPLCSLRNNFDRLVRGGDVSLVKKNPFVRNVRDVIISLTKFDKRDRATSEDQIDLIWP